MSVRRISMSAGQRFLSTVSQSSSNPRNSLSDRPDRAFGIEIFGSAPMRFSGRIVVQGHAALRLRTERFGRLLREYRTATFRKQTTNYQ